MTDSRLHSSSTCLLVPSDYHSTPHAADGARPRALPKADRHDRCKLAATRTSLIEPPQERQGRGPGPGLSETGPGPVRARSTARRGPAGPPRTVPSAASTGVGLATPRRRRS